MRESAFPVATGTALGGPLLDAGCGWWHRILT